MINIAHSAICLGIFWTSFRRAVIMDETTNLKIVVSMACLGTMGLAMLFAPLAWQTPISLPIVLLEGAILGVQSITTGLWSKGVPDAFRTPK